MRKTNNKRIIKYLATAPDASIVKLILKKADTQLAKGICNSAYNIIKGDIPLSRGKKRLFSHYRKIFADLTSPRPLILKKRYIQRGAGFLVPLIPILLSTVLTTLGSTLFNK